MVQNLALHLLCIYSILLAKWRDNGIFAVECIYSLKAYLEEFYTQRKCRKEMIFKPL